MNNLSKEKQELFQHLTDLEVDVINTICDIVDIQIKEYPEDNKDYLFLIGIHAFTSKLHRYATDSGYGYSRPIDKRGKIEK